jgi:hypothetical protein
VKLVCPSCAVSLRIPDQWTGQTFICAKCGTQVTAPERSKTPPRSWLASPGWVAVVLGELLLLAVVGFLAVAFARDRPPEGVPVLRGPTDGPPQVAAPGRSALIEWRDGREAVGGHFRVLRQDLRVLDRQGSPIAAGVRLGSNFWPEALLREADPPPTRPITLIFELDLPADERLAGEPLRLVASLGLEYAEPAKDAGPVQLRQATVACELPFVVATREEAAALDAHVRGRRRLGRALFGSAVAAVMVAVLTVALAQKRLTVICPKCGRATQATYTHEAGELYVSKCPHADRGPR